MSPAKACCSVGKTTTHVGQLSRACRAWRRSSGPSGCLVTADISPARENTEGAIHRQVSQSAQHIDRSTGQQSGWEARLAGGGGLSTGPLRDGRAGRSLRSAPMQVWST